ncbi:MAG: uroporphyrinogen-III synthase [Candidatus Sericytochromatia bacterium]|nr:uroporphyrinogen-III synthase [Candidatus Sericytochromatia bacterium]
MMYKPLSKKRIIITRPKKQAESFVIKLEELGAEVVLFPTIEIIPLIIDDLIRAIKNIDHYQWLIFTSTNSVEIFFNNFIKHITIDQIKKINIAVVGKKISNALNKIGLEHTLMPEKYTSENLAKLFLNIDIKNKNILIPGSKISINTLQIKLKELGANVDFIAIYDTVKPSNKSLESVVESIKDIDYITFTSPSSVNNFFEIIQEYNLPYLAEKAKIICIGPVTQDAINQDLKNKCLMPDEHTIEGMIKTIILDSQKII